MTELVPWVDFTFGLLEGWWLFEDTRVTERGHALARPEYWDKILRSVGYGHVDWTEGNRPEANLQRLIIAMASGPRYARVALPKPLSSSLQFAKAALTDSTGRQQVIDAYVHDYTIDHHTEYTSLSRSPPATSSISEGQCVLVTGASGSLGSHLVEYFARLPNVHTVVCLNRLSTTDATLRQKQSFEARGISLDAESESKLQVLEADTSKPLLGLPTDIHDMLLNTVTHVVHNAWPMSLTRPIRAYEPQFRVMQNLINLGREVVARRPAPFKFGFQFISSIGTVGCHPLWTGEPLVPEESMNAKSVLPVGYADAKLVCEHMLEETLSRNPKQYRAMSVRVAQIAGSTSNGYWNPVEHLAFLIKSSQTLKVLPNLEGTLSWCPVNDAASSLGELLVSDTTPYPIYHIENPVRQPWQDMLVTLGDALDIPRDNIIPFDSWVDRIRRFPGSTSDNPAGKLAEFFETHFIRMSCGSLILDTVKSKEHSETLRNMGLVRDGVVSKYIDAWKKIGFLH